MTESLYHWWEVWSYIAVMSAGKVVKLNIYIKSGHGSVMKKQLFYLYKWRIVRRLMDAYFISWKDEKLRNEIKIKLQQPLARNDQAVVSSIIIERLGRWSCLMNLCCNSWKLVNNKQCCSWNYKTFPSQELLEFPSFHPAVQSIQYRVLTVDIFLYNWGNISCKQ